MQINHGELMIFSSVYLDRTYGPPFLGEFETIIFWFDDEISFVREIKRWIRPTRPSVVTSVLLDLADWFRFSFNRLVEVVRRMYVSKLQNLVIVFRDSSINSNKTLICTKVENSRRCCPQLLILSSYSNCPTFPSLNNKILKGYIRERLDASDTFIFSEGN